MHLLKWLYPGLNFKRWMLLFSAGVMLVSLGLALFFNYKYLDLIEEHIFRAVYLWQGSYDYWITTVVGLVMLVLGLGIMLFATRFVIRSVITAVLPDNSENLVDIIYEKRRHALMGERIGMDISNIIWDRCVSIVENNDYEGCKEAFIKIFAMECPFTEEEFISTQREELEEKTFQTAMETFKRKTDRLQEMTYPTIKEVYETQGDRFERIVVPITDGKRIVQIVCDLKEAYETEAKSVIKQFEKNVMLHIIDDCWKENLRQLDELRHSVQNASYEQKDPLLVFKLESVKLFDNMVNEMNDRITSLLMRAQLHVEQEVREAAPEVQQQQQYTESKEDLDEAAQRAARQQDTRESAAPQNRTPIMKDKMPRRNDPCPCGSGKKFKDCHGKGIA